MVWRIIDTKEREGKMDRIVYVDLLFLINFSMDFLCFYITAKILSVKLTVGRAVIACAIGGIYSDIALFLSVGRISGLVIDLSVCALMCAVAFYKRKEGKRIFLHILVYFAVSMALGGFMTAIFNLLNQVDMPSGDSGGDGISILTFAILAGVSALITLVGGRLFKSKSLQKDAEIEIVINGKSKKIKGFFDSGNLLREPISAKPCIICDREALRDIVPFSIYIASKNEMRTIDGALYVGIRLVPIKTAKGDGMLVAIPADDIKIYEDDKVHSVDAYIALSELGEFAYGARALIPIELAR